MPVQFTTDLPDAGQPELNNGVLDEIGAAIELVTNNGDYRAQIRETEEETWDGDAAGFSAETVAYDADPLEIIFTDRLDGEEYEVRLRTETDNVIGEWTTPVSIISKFPGSDELDIVDVGKDFVELAWVENADNEDGQRVIRERWVNSAWWPEVLIEDVGPDTESYVDETVHPDTQYRYRIQSYTEFVEADSNLETTTTEDIGVERAAAGSAGWHVEIETESGRILTPAVGRTATLDPVINSLPTVQIPVRKSDRWDDLIGASMRVWKDGVRRPIDTLVDVEQRRSETVLVGRGGSDIARYVDGVEIPEQESHLAATELIEENTDYLANVDDPESDTRPDVLLLSASGSLSLPNAIDDSPLDDDVPLTFDGDRLDTLQTGWFGEAVNAAGSGSEQFTQTGLWSDGSAVRLQSNNDQRRFSFSNEYTMPEGRIWFMFSVPDETHPAFVLEIEIDGGSWQQISSFAESAFPQGEDVFDLRITQRTYSSDIPPGDHRFRIRCTSTTDGDIYLDSASIRDDRFEYTTDVLPENEVVPGPEEYPDAQTVRTIAVTSAETVIGGSIAVDTNNTDGKQELALRNSPSGDWVRQSNTDLFETDFEEGGTILQGEITLGRWTSDPTTSPSQGDARQFIDGVELRANLDETPLVLDFSEADDLETILNRVAATGQFVWEVAWDRDESSQSVEWTQPGQRQSNRALSLVDFRADRGIEERYERVLVYGTAQRREGFTFSTGNNFDQPSGIGQQNIVSGSERIYDVDDNTFERGIDYTLDYQVGAISIFESGDMELETEYVADVEWKPVGESAREDVDDPDTLRVDDVGVSTGREADQIALAIRKRVQDPLVNGELTIPESGVQDGLSLVEALDVDEIPGDGQVVIRNVSVSAESVRIDVSSRPTEDEVVAEVRDRVNSVQRRT